MIVTDGGRFGGYGLFLQPKLRPAVEGAILPEPGTRAAAIRDCCCVWRGRSMKWSRVTMGLSYAALILGLAAGGRSAGDEDRRVSAVARPCSL